MSPDERDKVQALIDKPFTFEEHGYLDKGGYYILKSAIRQRLNELDPQWKNTQPEILHIDDDLVTMRGGLVLFKQTRYAVGTGIIQRTRMDRDSKQEVPLGSFEISRNKAKAMKSAARDLLPRAVLEHGIGEYMRDMPKSVKDAIAKEGAAPFKGWLQKLHAAWEAKYIPPHWALNGGGKRVSLLMTLWELPWKIVAAHIETDKTLQKMSDTVLSEVEFIARLVELKSDQPQTQPPESVMP